MPRFTFSALCVTAMAFYNSLCVAKKVSRKNEYNFSIGDLDPKSFWEFKSVSHNSFTEKPKKTEIMIFNAAYLVSDAPATGISSLMFTKESSSYARIENDGYYDGNNAFCWMFYVKPISIQKATLFQYKGMHGYPGLKFILNNGILEVEVQNGIGKVTYEAKSADLEVAANVWKFVGVNFNSLWSTNQLDIITMSAGNVVFDSFDIDPTAVNALGDVTIGADYQGMENFNGMISCVQFYSTSVTGKPQKTATDLCDPLLWTSSYGQLTADASYYDNFNPSEMSTTAFSTADSDIPTTEFSLADYITTDSNRYSDVITDISTTESVSAADYITTDSNRYSDVITDISTTESVSAADYITTDSNRYSDVITGMSSPIHHIDEKCVRFRREAIDSTVQYPLESVDDLDKMECSKRCILMPKCRKFAIKEEGVAKCLLGGKNSSYVYGLGFSLFILI